MSPPEEEIFEAAVAKPAARPSVVPETFIVDEDEQVDQPVIDKKNPNEQSIGVYNRRARRVIAKKLGLNRFMKELASKQQTHESSKSRKKRRKQLMKH